MTTEGPGSNTGDPDTPNLPAIFSLRKQILLTAVIALLLVVVASVALAAGAYEISLADVYGILFEHFFPFIRGPERERVLDTIVWNMRVPRILMAIAAGAALAAAGAVYQGCFRNPLVDPFILGVSSGAAFGAALGIVFPGFFLSIQFSAFLFGGLAVAGAYFLARTHGYTPALTLILAGIVIASVFEGLVSILKYISTDAALRTIVFWIMGGFYYSSWGDAFLNLPVVVVSCIILILLAWKLNVLSMGEEESRALGVDPQALTFIFVVIATLLTALVTATVGIIPWVGLMMPHAARMIMGPDHRAVIPAAALLGGIYLLICDTLARTLTGSEIPVGIIASIIGAPYLFYLIRTRGQMVFG
ncbi:MAG: iron ABC transporter permease [Methanoregulaceae archaeon]|nr:iron ABC transporter permease [Methanoregulaceae archaeon]